MNLINLSRILAALVLCYCSVSGAWEQIGPYGGSLSAVACARTNENIFYCVSSKGPSQVFRSIDGGATWTRVSVIQDVVAISDIEVDPFNPAIVYATGYNTVYRSTDSGVNWTSYSVPSAINIADLTIDPATSSRIYVAGQYYNGSAYVGAIFKSTNSGQTWTVTQLSSSSGSAYCVTIDPANTNILYAGGYYYSAPSNFPGLYKSTNQGTSFSPTTSGIDTLAYSIHSIAVNPGNSNIVYAGSYRGGIYRSTNGGGTWVCVQPTLQFIMSMATTVAATNIVYAGGDTVIMKSTDAGVSWSNAGSGYGGIYKTGRDLCISQNSSSLVHTVDSKGFFKTTNGGANWQASNQGIVISPVRALGIAPSSPSTVYLEYEGVGIYKTTNNGTSWNLLSTPLECGAICEFAVHNTNPDIVLGLEGLG